MDTQRSLPVQPAGSIWLACTPIGNTLDASSRLRQALSQADLVAAEDTRRALNLANRLELRINGRLISLHEHNEREKAAQLVEAAQNGSRVLVISDAGMPTVSDPGYNLTQIALERNIPMSVIPGPSAVLTSLALSGLPTDRFTFEGFLSRKDSARERQIASLAKEERTMVFFESPKRVHGTLEVMVNHFGAERKAALCRELTKTYEEVKRGTLAELVAATKGEVLGEISLVVAGAPEAEVSIEKLVAQVEELREDGLKTKAAVKQVAAAAGVSKNELYEAVLHSEANG
ncbi:16S rRNA (cytidine(1402)-2'-O)-methyltransferase [Boudabousia tangfeifanii]|uniref:Ribosomal RNA small subunit methyltransferase I n=1 Tax=Boudabousia tangfeifanii TaxID=1912795 RepID=A0A1D9MLG0_9ACTO|nr:16S rRNA (cytidine(1402)-2'-O)-methyltransferase [Boudabousia tangfeifanii]AOZ73029.1 16S rRNA (cytidine(1402)-2'-O)-methyltransferase [Boudabousia tangfeifanii]